MRLKNWIRKNFKSIIITFGVVAFLAYFFSGLFQKQAAVTAAYIYATINHSDKGLSFSNVEYLPLMDAYVVTFTDKDGRRVKMWLGPDFFPVIVGKNSLWSDL